MQRSREDLLLSPVLLQAKTFTKMSFWETLGEEGPARTSRGHLHPLQPMEGRALPSSSCCCRVCCKPETGASPRVGITPSSGPLCPWQCPQDGHRSLKWLSGSKRIAFPTPRTSFPIPRNAFPIPVAQPRQPSAAGAALPNQGRAR